MTSRTFLVAVAATLALTVLLCWWAAREVSAADSLPRCTADGACVDSLVGPYVVVRR